MVASKPIAVKKHPAVRNYFFSKMVREMEAWRQLLMEHNILTNMEYGKITNVLRFIY